MQGSQVISLIMDVYRLALKVNYSYSVLSFTFVAGKNSRSGLAAYVRS